jgi:branched-chain amino acid aminotransferase
MTTPESAPAPLPAIELKPSARPLPAAERAALLANPGCGRVFTDHMVTIRWSEGRGWHEAQLVPYGPLEIDPSNMTLHYGQAIFEGLKAYRQPDGGVATFRPRANAARFRASARRMAMPELPDDLFVAAVEALVTQDRQWVPDQPEQTLYLRPFMIATENGLGVRPASEYLFLLIASPAAAYFHGGVKPVSVWLSKEYVRAAPGGTGAAKCAGNYAASLVAQAQAAAQGCDQVVWLDAVEHRWIEEMGGMNLYFVYGSGPDARIVTPALTGSLLPGITRDSLLALAADLGYATEEGRISVEDWQRGNEDGSLTEVFACGTAAVITPVGEVKSTAADWTVADGQPGEVTLRLRKALLDIQTGAAEDTHGWMHRIL